MRTARAAALAVVNMASSVLIVLCNKILFKAYAFNYPLTLTLIHFVVTFIGVEVCRRVGLFKGADMSARAILPLSCAFVGFDVLTNIRRVILVLAWQLMTTRDTLCSLQLNSVGLYQILKICTTPAIVIIEFFGYNKSTPLDRLAALALICVGAAGAITCTNHLARAASTLRS